MKSVFSFILVSIFFLYLLKGIIESIVKYYKNKKANICLNIMKSMGCYDLEIKNIGRKTAKNISIEIINVKGLGWLKSENPKYSFKKISPGDSIVFPGVINSEYIIIPPDDQITVKLSITWKNENNNIYAKNKEIVV